MYVYMLLCLDCFQTANKERPFSCFFFSCLLHKQMERLKMMERELSFVHHSLAGVAMNKLDFTSGPHIRHRQLLDSLCFISVARCSQSWNTKVEQEVSAVWEKLLEITGFRAQSFHYCVVFDEEKTLNHRLLTPTTGKLMHSSFVAPEHSYCACGGQKGSSSVKKQKTTNKS